MRPLRHPGCTRSRARLRLEALEDRSLPSGTSPSALVELLGAHLVSYSGQSFSGVVATFRTTDPAGWHASIDWGDGSQSDGTFTTGSSGQYGVVGTKSYHDTGTFTITVSFSHADSVTLTVLATAEVLPDGVAGPAFDVAISFVSGQIVSAYAVKRSDPRDFPLFGESPQLCGREGTSQTSECAFSLWLASGTGSLGTPSAPPSLQCLPSSAMPCWTGSLGTPSAPPSPIPAGKPPAQPPPPNGPPVGVASPGIDPTSIVVWRGTLDPGGPRPEPLPGAQSRQTAAAVGALAVGARQPFTVSIRSESGHGDEPGQVLIAVQALTPDRREALIRITIPFDSVPMTDAGRAGLDSENGRPDSTLLAALFGAPGAETEIPPAQTEVDAVRALEEYFARLHLLQEASRPAGGLTCTSLAAPAEIPVDAELAGEPGPRRWLWRAGVAGLLAASLAPVVRDRQRYSFPCFKLAPLAGGRC
jgi:hypothetical protein